jgi:hypothetical protein
MESSMTTQTDEVALRPLTDAEIDDVGGGLTFKAFGFQLDVILDDNDQLHVWVGTYNADGSGRSIRLI